MKFYINIVKIIAALIALSANACSGNQPSYQVSLYVRFHPQEAPVHVCNGVIVQSRLILTTATCIHYKFSSNKGSAFPIDPSVISIISGSSKFNEELMLHVDDIFVADNFNYTTGENDLALLRLNGILPLDTRNDISWITLEAGNEYDNPCLANFYARKSPNSSPDYIQSEQLPLLDSELCRNASGYPNNRDDDICSLYYLPTDLTCNELQALQNYNGDRGTGLVCGNKLVGLLSSILPWKNTTDCKEKPLRAFYAAVVPRIPWIFDIITEEDQKLLNKGEYIESSPYASEANAFIEPKVTEPAATPVSTTFADVQTTELLDHQTNNAAVCGTMVCKFFYGIFGTIYSIILVLSH